MRSIFSRIAVVLAVAAWSVVAPRAAAAEAFHFEPQELPEKVTVGYAVSLVDVNADKKLDIVVVDSKRLIWFENPSWKLHTVMSAPDKSDNVCVAPYDIDGDGQLDFALGADWTLDTHASGSIQWFGRQKDQPDAAWPLHPIGAEPTTHRMRWFDLDGDGRSELVVLPLMGRDTKGPQFAERGVRMLAYSIPKHPATDRWTATVLTDELHVSHNFYPADLDHDGKLDLLVASFEGVSLLQRPAEAGKPWNRTLIGEGNQKTSPNRGASEVKLGTLAGGRDYIATIEPWHGHQVVVYTRPEGSVAESATKMWKRHVVDEQLKWGHAVWCANLDGDEDQELIVGVRDDQNDTARRGVRIYDPQGDDPAKWPRTLLDTGAVAVEDLQAADLDGDGRTDLVAVGRQTHNIRIYWNRAK
jgi:hypothetical protein